MAKQITSERQRGPGGIFFQPHNLRDFNLPEQIDPRG